MDAIDALKQKVLTLAIQGKLVPQNLSDEPASVLLEKIKAEKEALVKAGKIKKDKQESYIYKGSDNNYYEKNGLETKDITEEIPFEIPENWEWVRLGNISNINGGFAFKSTKYVPNGVRVIRISDFDELGIKNKNIVRYSFSKELLPYELEKNNIILAMTGGTVGKSYLVEHLDEPMYVNQRVATIKILNPLEIKYINTVILSDITQKIIKYSKNSTNDNISMDTIKGFLFPLPPISEQERIVGEIESIFKQADEVKSNQAELSKLKDGLKNKILDLAIQGKLVEQDPNDEPASVLLEKIRAEKQELIKQGKIKKDKQESYIFKGADNRHYEKIGLETKDITDEIPFEIPNSWQWARLGNISNINGGFAFKSTKYVPNGVRVIRISDFDELGIKNKNIVRYSFSKELLPYELEKNNIILAMTGGTVGKSYLVEHLDEPMYVNQRVATIKILNPLEIKYINTVILSDITQKIIKYSKNSTNDNISMNTIKGFLVPLPPLAEQQRIVAKIKILQKQINLL